MANKDRPPFWQMVYDDLFLLFLLGIVLPTISYTIWGLIDIANVLPFVAK